MSSRLVAVTATPRKSTNSGVAMRSPVSWASVGGAPLIGVSTPVTGLDGMSSVAAGSSSMCGRIVPVYGT